MACVCIYIHQDVCECVMHFGCCARGGRGSMQIFDIVQVRGQYHLTARAVYISRNWTLLSPVLGVKTPMYSWPLH